MKLTLQEVTENINAQCLKHGGSIDTNIIEIKYTNGAIEIDSDLHGEIEALEEDLETVTLRKDTLKKENKNLSEENAEQLKEIYDLRAELGKLKFKHKQLCQNQN